MPSFGRNFFGSMDPMLDFDTDANSNEGTIIFGFVCLFVFFFYLKLRMRNSPRDCVHVWLQTGVSTRTWSSPNPSATAR